MGSSPDLSANRCRRLHQILGEGLVADVVLWRQSNITAGILLVTVASWVVFEISGYTLLSFVSSVLLLLTTILFLWAKSAAILNRPPPPLPKWQLSEEMVNQAATLIRTNVNDLLAASQNIALGKDTKLFVKVAVCLLLMAIVGGLTDLLTLGYTSLLIILTVPVLYERYGDDVDRFVKRTGYKIQKLYYKFDADVICRAKNICVQKQKLS